MSTITRIDVMMASMKFKPEHIALSCCLLALLFFPSNVANCQGTGTVTFYSLPETVSDSVKMSVTFKGNLAYLGKYSMAIMKLPKLSQELT
jgi:hypothetical protein